MKKIIILALLFIAQSTLQHEFENQNLNYEKPIHKCEHHKHATPSLSKLTESERLFHQYVPMRPQHKADAYHPMRVHFDYSGIEQSLQDQYKEAMAFIKDILVPTLQKHLLETFRVPESQITLTKEASGKCIPNFGEQHVNPDTDMYVTLRLFYSEGYTVGSCGHCEQDPRTHRPISANMNFNLRFLAGGHTPGEPFPVDDKLPFWFETILHELYHAMGFNDDLFKDFTDEYGRLRGEENVWTTTAEGPFTHLVTTPKVLKHAREHFKDPNLRGVPVEDNGGPGSKHSHWERIAIGNDIMMANAQFSPVLSEFTLNLFEDSGWYQINHQMAEPHFWGKGQSQILTSSHSTVCESYHGHACKPTPEIPDFREKPREMFPDYTRYGFCGDESSTFENHCHFITPFSNADCRLEKLGGRYIPFKGTSWIRNGFKCFVPKCEGGVLIYKDGDTEHRCTREGEIITVSDGQITCPDVADFCDQYSHSCPEDCGVEKGRCLVGGKCWCYPGHLGPYCTGEKEGYTPTPTPEPTPTPTPTPEPTPTPIPPAPKPCPNDCHDNGICDDGVCLCNEKFTGVDCNELRCPNNCSKRGECHNGICKCEHNYTGLDCSIWMENVNECPHSCFNNGVCYEGACYCNRGYTGYYCGHPIVWW